MLKALLVFLISGFAFSSLGNLIIVSFNNSKDNKSLFWQKIDLLGTFSFESIKHYLTDEQLQNLEIKYELIIKEFKNNGLKNEDIILANASKINTIFLKVSTEYKFSLLEQKLLQAALRDTINQNKVIKKLKNNSKIYKSSYEVSGACILQAKDSNGMMRQIYYKGTTIPLYLKNLFTSEKISISNNSDYNKISNISEIYTDGYTWRYVTYLNTCETALLVASYQKLNISHLIYNKIENAQIITIVKTIFTAINLIRTAIQSMTHTDDYYYKYARGYLLHLATVDALQKSSNNLQNGIAVQFWWRKWKKNFISINSQKYMMNNEEYQWDYETGVEPKRYSRQFMGCKTTSSNYPNCEWKTYDNWNHLFLAIGGYDGILAKEIDKLVNQ